MATEHRAHGGPYAAAVLRGQPHLRRDLELAERAGVSTLAEFYDLPEVELRIAKWESERTTCKFHGGPLDECADDERDWFPQRMVCQPTMQLQAAMALYADLHEERPFHDGTFQNWAKERSRAFPFRFDDGVSFYLAETDVDPEDNFLSLDNSVVEKAVGDVGKAQ